VFKDGDGKLVPVCNIITIHPTSISLFLMRISVQFVNKEAGKLNDVVVFVFCSTASGYSKLVASYLCTYRQHC
jgi:hypothetical protein